MADLAGVSAEVIERYRTMEQTGCDHLKVIYEHLGHRRPTDYTFNSKFIQRSDTSTCS